MIKNRCYLQKEDYLYEENNFSIDLTADNNIDGNFFKNKDEYVMSGLKVKPKEVDLTKWNEVTIIKKISD